MTDHFDDLWPEQMEQVLNLSISGLPTIAITVSFIVIFEVPAWMAAKLVGAHTPTLLRSILALLLGMVGTIVSASIAGAAAPLPEL